MHDNVVEMSHALHHDTDIFTRKDFPYEELYGPKWNGHHFNPLFRNIGTGALHASSHHNKDGGPRTSAHFDVASKSCRYGFCLNWHTVLRDNVYVRVRCHEVFLINSAGCGRKGHQNSVLKDEGPNSIFRKLLNDKAVSWEVLKNPEEETRRVVDPKQKAREAAEAQAIAVEDELSREGVVSAKAISASWAQQKKDMSLQEKILREEPKGERAQQLSMRGQSAQAPTC